MGKAVKQRKNKLKKQIDNNQHNKDFLKMIEAMQDDKMYRIKKNKGYLFDGLNAPGAYWKTQFLTKKEDSDRSKQN